MRIGLAQINSTLGDFAGNRQKIVEFSRRAREQRCDLVIFPEMSLMGYLPNDLLERASVVDEQLREFAKLRNEIPAGIGVIIGLITRNEARTAKKKGKPYFNTAALLEKGKPPKFFRKELLPTYDVFDEARHIEKGDVAKGLVTFRGKRLLITICEDIWGWKIDEYPSNYMVNPLLALKRKLGARKLDLVINMSASPFTAMKTHDRLSVVSQTAKLFKAPVAYVNLVGSQDELIFDGGSFICDPRGKVMARSLYFNEDLNLFDLGAKEGWIRDEPETQVEKYRQALVLGIRDYVRKTGFSRVHLGLSGGIDSAVVACLAVDALGPGKVTAVTLPGPFNEPKSKTLAEKLARNLHIRCLDLPINDAYEVLEKTLKASLGEFAFGVVNENIQSRLRGLMLMALSNKESSMLLTTGNKSEYATGYATLYGDMCGGLAPIADLVKGEVYELARHYNKEHELIPDEIITRAPSAELRPNQKDQDSLPPYDELDESVKRLVEFAKPARSKTDKWLIEVLMKTEFKRWQAPPVLKVSKHAFGRGRRVPIAHKSRV